MKTDVRTYVRISQGSGEDEKDFVVPESKLKKMVENQEAFNELSRLSYNETEFENIEEFTEMEADEQTKIDFLNRGWVSYQQVAAKAYLSSSDFEPSDNPIDITALAVAPRERRKATPVDKSRKSMLNLAKEDPAAFAQLLAEFREAAASMGLTVS